VTRTLTAAALSLLLASTASAQQPTAPQAPPKVQVLIVTGQNGHNWKGTTPILRRILEDTGLFEVRVAEEIRGAGPETFAPYDLVVLNYFERGRPELRWGERTNTAFLEYLRAGKGVVVYHFSMAAFDGWTEYEKLSGGNWRPGNGHHSAPHDFVVDIRDREHPITKGLKLKLPQAKDELYGNLRWQPAGTYQVLATASDDHALYAASRTDARAPQPLVGPSADEPMLWTTQYGQGRVFVTALGHDVDQVQTPTFMTTFARGAEWAATGKVTIPIPAALYDGPTPQPGAQAATAPGYVPRGMRPAKGRAPGMKVTDLGKGPRTYRINLTKGDEVLSALTDFAEQYHIKNAHFTGLGALNKGIFGWADPESGLGQKRIDLDQEAEVVSLVGSISTNAQGRTNVHAHGSVAYSDGSIHGGHWWEAYVSIITEIFVTEEDGAAAGQGSSNRD
jgi:predicted DNA-binding protein with PD1-like motif/type 1 glutamine amidotransferase